MNLAPLADVNMPLAIHLVTVVIAILSSLLILIRPKGTLAHKVTGRVGAMALMITAIASFGINSMDSPHFGLSPIHVFSVTVLVSVPYAIIQVRRGNIRAHRLAMTSVAVSGLGIAGALTFLPGRLMHTIFIG